MSHFPVAVFTTNGLAGGNELLAPYFGGKVCEPYVRFTKEQLIRKEREFFQSIFEAQYSMWQADAYHPEHIKLLKPLPELLKRTDEQVYQDAISNYEPDMIAPEGGILTRNNPNSKWDWYVVGGRWTGKLILKNGCEGKRGTSRLQDTMSQNYDSALMTDVDFEKMKQEQLLSLQPYESVVEYTEILSLFHTCAVITPDGKWHAQEKSLCHTTLDEMTADERDWRINYYKHFIQPAIENEWHITIVDCHDCHI